jgi:hypothetical protein
MFPTLAVIEWQATIVACVIMVVIGTIMIVTIVWEGTAAAIRMWAALGTLSGLAIGGIVTYFFGAKPQLEAKDSQIAAIQYAFRSSQQSTAKVGEQINMLAEKIQPFAYGASADIKKISDLGKSLQPSSPGESSSPTTSEASGTISEFTPGAMIVLNESSGPVSYRFSGKVAYTNRIGMVLDEATVRAKIKGGVPVRVHYVREGKDMVVDRLILEEN